MHTLNELCWLFILCIHCLAVKFDYREPELHQQNCRDFDKNHIGAEGTFIDYGNPYTDQPLKVADLTITITGQQSLIHTKAYFPQEPGLYPAVLFLPGLNGYILSEFYDTVLRRTASHGFFVFALDYKFPLEHTKENNLRYELNTSKKDVERLFKQFTWLQVYMTNKTIATIAWNHTALMCHSAACDATLKMIKEKPQLFKSSVFLEPVSFDVQDKVNNSMPAFMYGTELSEVGLTKCCIPGYDYNKFYEIWGCPKIVMEVANFGHCGILDPTPWTACKDAHFCTTTNNTSMVPQYREFVQGAASSFLVHTLQGRPDALQFITDKSLIPLKLVELRTDINCTML